MTSNQVVELAYSVVNNAKSCINKINSVISDLNNLIPDFNVIKQNISDNVSADDIINNSSLAISKLISQINTSIASANTVIGNIKQSCNNYLDFLENDFNSSNDEKSQVSLPRVSAVSSTTASTSTSSSSNGTTPINNNLSVSISNSLSQGISNVGKQSINDNSIARSSVKIMESAIPVVTVAASDSSIKSTTVVNASKTDASVFNTNGSLNSNNNVKISNNANDNTSTKNYYVEEDVELKKHLNQYIKEGSLGNINSSDIEDWDECINKFLSSSGFDEYVSKVLINNKKTIIHSINNDVITFDNVSSLDELITNIQDYFNISN